MAHAREELGFCGVRGVYLVDPVLIFRHVYQPDNVAAGGAELLNTLDAQLVNVAVYADGAPAAGERFLYDLVAGRVFHLGKLREYSLGGGVHIDKSAVLIEHENALVADVKNVRRRRYDGGEVPVANHGLIHAEHQHECSERKGVIAAEQTAPLHDKLQPHRRDTAQNKRDTALLYFVGGFPERQDEVDDDVNYDEKNNRIGYEPEDTLANFNA